MVGREYEAGGIAKHGAKMVTAVACTRVPKLTVVIGGSFGAGQLLDVRPGLLAPLPVHVAQRPHLGDGRRAGRHRARARSRAGRPGAGEEEFKAPIRDQYEHQGHPYYATARLWDDGVIDPRTPAPCSASPCPPPRTPRWATRLRRLPDVSPMPPPDRTAPGRPEVTVFDTVLVANRGEIAVRVIRTLRAHGHPLGRRLQRRRRRRAAHAALADVAVRIGPAAGRAELPVDRAGARGGPGAPARRPIHPGYGFLSENAAFAARLRGGRDRLHRAAVAAIEAMGDKIRAKQTVATAGVPVVPGSDGAGPDDDSALDAAVEQVGFPVLLKPSAGGGGKGMRVVHQATELADAIAAARREARGSLRRRHPARRALRPELRGTSRSRCWPTPTATSIHLGERECSLQRRHQKIIEEAPSPLLDTAERGRRWARAAVEAARAVGYTGAGTVEFIVAGRRPRRVLLHGDEHPAAGRAPGHRADHRPGPRRAAAAGRGGRAAAARPGATSRLDGHAIEARVYAEDPAARLPARRPAPCSGCVEPSGPGVRVDARLAVGTVVGTDYDPMLAKVIAWAPDRDDGAAPAASARSGDTAAPRAWTPTSAFLRALLADPDVRRRAARHRADRAPRRRADRRRRCRPTCSRPRPCTRWPSWSPPARSSTRSTCPTAGGSASRPGRSRRLQARRAATPVEVRAARPGRRRPRSRVGRRASRCAARGRAAGTATG